MSERAASGRELSRNDERRARRGKKHHRGLSARSRSTMPAFSRGKGKTAISAGREAGGRLSRRCSTRRGLRRPRRRGGCRRCGSSTSFSVPTRSGPTIRPGSLPARGRGGALPKVLSVAEVDRLLTHGRGRSESPMCPQQKQAAALRLYVLLELLYATGHAGFGTGEPAARGGDARRELSDHHRQGQQGADRAGQRPGARCGQGVADDARAGGPWLFPAQRRGRLSQPAGVCARSQGAGGTRRDFVGPGCAACAAPRLCQPSAAGRRRSAGGADAARARRYLDDADLYPCARREAAERWSRRITRWRTRT